MMMISAVSSRGYGHSVLVAMTTSRHSSALTPSNSTSLTNHQPSALGREGPPSSRQPWVVRDHHPTVSPGWWGTTIQLSALDGEGPPSNCQPWMARDHHPTVSPGWRGTTIQPSALGGEGPPSNCQPWVARDHHPTVNPGWRGTTIQLSFDTHTPALLALLLMMMITMISDTVRIVIGARSFPAQFHQSHAQLTEKLTWEKRPNSAAHISFPLPSIHQRLAPHRFTVNETGINSSVLKVCYEWRLKCVSAISVHGNSSASGKLCSSARNSAACGQNVGPNGQHRWSGNIISPRWTGSAVVSMDYSHWPVLWCRCCRWWWRDSRFLCGRSWPSLIQWPAAAVVIFFLVLVFGVFIGVVD